MGRACGTTLTRFICNESRIRFSKLVVDGKWPLADLGSESLFLSWKVITIVIEPSETLLPNSLLSLFFVYVCFLFLQVEKLLKDEATQEKGERARMVRFFCHKSNHHFVVCYSSGCTLFKFPC